MATAPEKLPSQEKLLTDYVRRLEKLKDGRGLAHIHLSKLLPFNRRDQHIRTAAGNFDVGQGSLDPGGEIGVGHAHFQKRKDPTPNLSKGGV